MSLREQREHVWSTNVAWAFVNPDVDGHDGLGTMIEEGGGTREMTAAIFDDVIISSSSPK